MISCILQPSTWPTEFTRILQLPLVATGAAVATAEQQILHIFDLAHHNGALAYKDET